MATQTHVGSCHCGKVRYQVELDLEQPVNTCNCSMCGRSGTMLQFVPESAFTLLSGEDELRDYGFNQHKIHHSFCSNCGIKAFARGSGPGGDNVVAINVRCLEDVDLKTLKVHEFDGKAL